MIKYFDNAATTKLDNEVLNEMMPYLTENYANPSSIYSVGKKAKEAITIARMKIAEAIGANVNEIYFTSCGSESDNLAIKGIAFANSRYGNHIITSSIEHPAVINTCKFLEEMGFRVTYLKPNANGIIDVQSVKNAITPKTILISIMFANNEIGTLQPIKEIAEIAKRNNIYFHTDAVQAMGNVNVNVKELNVSALSMSAHKFYGPKGVGVLYVKEGVNFRRIQDGGHQEREKRSGTENVAGIVGTGKALEIATKNLDVNSRKMKALRDYYIENITAKIPKIRINGDLEKRLPGNSNVCFLGVDGAKLLDELDKREICASSGSACSAGLLQPSPVLLAIGVPKNIARSSLRITFGKSNTIEEVDYLIKSLIDIVG
jgi:cysteine desulfurase